MALCLALLHSLGAQVHVCQHFMLSTTCCWTWRSLRVPRLGGGQRPLWRHGFRRIQNTGESTAVKVPLCLTRKSCAPPGAKNLSKIGLVGTARPWQSLRGACHLRGFSSEEKAALITVEADRAYIIRVHGNIKRRHSGNALLSIGSHCGRSTFFIWGVVTKV